MKIVNLAAVAAVIAVVLAGCYLGFGGGVGTVGIEIPAPSVATGAADAEAVRVYVINGPSLLSVGDGVPYAEFDLEPADGETLEDVTVGPVPSGPGYQVALIFGNYENGAVAGSEVFVPVAWALSGEFTVYAGQATPIDLEPVESGFGSSAPLLGRSLIGIVQASLTTFVTATAAGIFELNTSLAVTNSASIPGGNALGIDYGQGAGGAPRVWVNTPTGLRSYTPGGAVGALNFGDPGVTLNPVLRSGGYVNGGDLFGYFQFDGGLGGFYDPGATGSGIQWLDNIDLSEFVSGQPVYDLAVDVDAVKGVSGYFATKLGAFRLEEEDLLRTYASVGELLEQVEFFSVTVDGAPAIITNVAVSGNNLFIGTPRGVVTIGKNAIGSDDAVTGTIVPGTKGLVTRQLAIGTNYKAIRTDHVVLVQAGTDPWTAFPVYGGVSGTVTGMYLDDLNGVLLLVGDKGLSYFDIDQIP